MKSLSTGGSYVSIGGTFFIAFGSINWTRVKNVIARKLGCAKGSEIEAMKKCWNDNVWHASIAN